MAKRHITWLEQADSLIHGQWGTEGETVYQQNQLNGDSRLQLCLLLDIAKSLRALRCINFLSLPQDIKQLRRAAEGLRRDAQGVIRRKRGRPVSSRRTR
jgi:hypothetical protein